MPRRRHTGSTAANVRLLINRPPFAAIRLSSPFIYHSGAHQNTLEWLPQVIASTLVVGLKYPVYAATLCGVWTTARFVYTIGYSTGVPAKVRNLSHPSRTLTETDTTVAQ